MHHAEQVQALLKTLLPKQRRVSSYKPAHPYHLEAVYVARLQRAIAAPLKRITWECLAPVVARYRAPTERADEFSDEDFIAAIGEAQVRFGQTVDVDAATTKAVNATAPQVEAFALEQQRKALRVLGIDAVGKDLFLATARNEWTRTNVNLIRTVGPEFFPKVQNHVIQAVHSGMRHETLAKYLKNEVLPLADSRCALIARDQVIKYNADLSRHQQQAVGLESYQWLAVHDRRTRQTHLELDGTTQKWSNPPTIGNPGEPIQCRCAAVPIL